MTDAEKDQAESVAVPAADKKNNLEEEIILAIQSFSKSYHSISLNLIKSALEAKEIIYSDNEFNEVFNKLLRNGTIKILIYSIGVGFCLTDKIEAGP